MKPLPTPPDNGYYGWVPDAPLEWRWLWLARLLQRRGRPPNPDAIARRGMPALAKLFGGRKGGEGATGPGRARADRPGRPPGEAVAGRGE